MQQYFHHAARVPVGESIIKSYEGRGRVNTLAASGRCGGDGDSDSRARGRASGRVTEEKLVRIE